VIDGKSIANEWEKSIAAEAAELTKELGRPPGLAVIVAGERPDSAIYVQRKQDACKRVGIDSKLYRLPSNVVEADVQTIVEQLSSDIHVDGILVQLPLPAGLKEEIILQDISIVKDVDGLSPINVGRMLMKGTLPVFSPCPALACIELLKRSDISIHNKKVVVLGDSNTVGLPLAVLFRDHGAAAVTICHRVAYESYEESRRETEAAERATADACLPNVGAGSSLPAGSSNDGVDPTSGDRAQPAPAAIKPLNKFLPDVCRTADILVVAVGHPELVTGDWVKPGAVVLDVGINVRDQGTKKVHKHKLVGDVHFAQVSKVASAITPVPGGVGPMTIAALLHNTLEAAKRHADIWKPRS
jgi:5,10-methylene-tetrahydrofolate dehydrogenase/methenyl tetrahydrofolate cyclohydrolase